MIRHVKKLLSGCFQDLAGAYHVYRYSQEIRKHPAQVTRFGFRFMGRDRMQEGSFEPDEDFGYVNYCLERQA